VVPRSLREILDQAERLADYFEHEFDPRSATEVPVAELTLRRAAFARVRAEQDLAAAVAAARADGLPWERIGTLLGTSAQAAYQRYRSVTA
jgi:hypothetical protein